MINPLDLVRKNILALQPYSTARDECRGGNISVWLDANENPYNNGLNRYPDPHHAVLKGKIAKLKDIDADCIFIGGSGSDEAIDLTFRVFCRPGIDKALIVTPTYGMYEVCANTNDVEIISVPLNADFSLPVDELLATARSAGDVKLMWICSPNNPTGNAHPLEQLEYIADNFNGMLVVDEAYVDFSTRGSMLSVLQRHRNVIVLQTFSKAWGLASLRVGMAFADAEVAKLFNRVKYPYNINGPTQAEIARRIDTYDVRLQADEIVAQRKMLAEALPGLDCVKRVFPSDANFLLTEVTEPDAIYDYLVEHGAIVRNRSHVPGCGNSLRITVGTPTENKRLLELLARYGTPDSEEKADAPDRVARMERTTSETSISIALNLDGEGTSEISTGLHFFDHMLWQIPHHAGISLRLICKGDLEVDEHHTMEDVAIALGDAIHKALGSKRGIDRYGFVLPMDESRAMVLIDFGGRIDFNWDVKFTREYVGDTPTEMYEHFFKSLCAAMHCNLHISATGTNNHHLIEAVFKAFARALKAAVHRDPFNYDVPSSKGLL
jgi:histidinol-phosphate aminotransferase